MDTIENLLRQATTAFHSKNLYQAEQFTRHILAIDAHHAKALNLLGIIAIETEHFAEAETLFKLAIAENRNAVELHENLGNLYLSQKQYEKAIDSYRNILTLQPDNQAIFNQIETIYYKHVLKQIKPAIFKNKFWNEAFLFIKQYFAEKKVICPIIKQDKPDFCEIKYYPHYIEFEDFDAFLLHQDKLSVFSHFFISHLLNNFAIGFASAKFVIFVSKQSIQDIKLPNIPPERHVYIKMLKNNVRHREIQHTPLSTPLFFLHIPKTAGSSLRFILDGLSINSIYLSNENKVFAIENYLKNKLLPDYDIVAGHLSFETYARYSDFLGERRIITVLRDPLERIYSLLAHARRPIKDPIRFATDGRMQAMRAYSLRYLIEDPHYAERLLRGQLERLGSDNTTTAKEIIAYPDIIYDKAIERMEKYNILVGVTEHMDWFLCCLSDYVGRPLLELPKRNVISNRNQYITDEEINYAENVLRPKLALEYKLYDYCLKRSYRQYQSISKQI